MKMPSTSDPIEQEATLQGLYLDSLAHLRNWITRDALRSVALDVVVKPDFASCKLDFAYNGGGAQNRRVTIRATPAILDWHLPEQREIFLFAALVAHHWIADGMRWNGLSILPTHLAHCRMAGCAASDSIRPSERWRVLHAQGSYAASQRGLLNEAVFPRTCIICEMPTTSDERRPDAHESCVAYGRYAMMAPQRLQAAIFAGLYDNA